MRARLDRLWRLAGTGCAFACLFFGGFVLAFALLPVLLVDSGRSHQHTRFVIHVLFGTYIRGLRWAGLLRLEMTGLEHLAAPGGRLIVANHPSLLDVVLLISLLPEAQCVVKHQLWKHWLLGPLMRRAGYIRNDLPTDSLMEACNAAIAAGGAVIIFPEGTRTTPGTVPRFRRGFANIAILAAVPIQLVVIRCDPPTLTKGEPWWRIPAKPPVFRLEFSESLDISPFLRYPYRSVGARRLVESLESFYREKLAHVGN